ncbi:MerR family DNA-binding transcriptional regulator [Acidovorax sp. BL-A-41-H1]|uniref:MerR family DNA-binding transcriptional regulator n=1 Tax=Acidovorax sp. BL-A-41-H1 TaxID=3421102 RepID=UPI003F7ADFD9
MQISELAGRTGVSVHALRHYERLGLLKPLRRSNGYRDYPETAQREVVFIAMSRQLGFALADIGPRLLQYRAGRLPVQEMVEALQERARELQTQIDLLQAQKQRVVDHQAWLRERLQKPASRRPGSGEPAAWPGVRSTTAPPEDSRHPRRPR